MISASHNPYRDNGIKFFGADGYKLTDEQELEIERRPGAARPTTGGRHASPSRPGRAELARRRRGLPARAPRRFRELDLGGLDVLLDCANGATYRVAPEIFRRLGANVTVLADEPDGRNINDGCGSTHIERLSEALRGGSHDLGFAFDGDGDRVMAVDREGEVVDGDELLALAALHLRAGGRLPGDGVAVTVMTNYGFHSAMRAAGIEVAVTAVGDRYVLEELRRRSWTLGGEQSGHIIEPSFNSTGDGIASALLTLEALGGRDLAERDAMHKLPQRLVNVPVRDRGAFAGADQVNAGVELAAQELAGRGRVLVRPAGPSRSCG